MEPEGSWPLSLKLATGPYAVSDASSPNLPTLFP
jgi:hypothetical protein